jgi:hydrogenase maturation protease
MDPYYFETVVVGVGNSILSDDGVGVHAARLLMRDRRLRPGVAILHGGALGLDLLSLIAGARRILFLDAVDGGAPGTVVRMDGEELLDTANERSVHQLGIADLMAALTLIAGNTPEVLLLGLRAPNVECGEPLSRAVRIAVASLVDEAVNQLRVWQSAPG